MMNPDAIISEADATRVLDQILSARQRRDRIKAACAAMLEAAEAEVAEVESMLPELETWAMANRPAKGKTIKLPVGQRQWRVVPGGPRIVDDAAALRWAREALPDAVRVALSIDKMAIKSYVTTTGELPPGVELQADEERFGVRG